MHGRIYKWPAWMLAVALICGASAGAMAQGNLPTALAADPGYQSPADSTRATPLMPASPSDTYLVSNAFNAEASLADRVAELEGALKKIKNKEAAAKKKAAGKMSLTAGGRIHYDWAMFSQEAQNVTNLGDHQNGNELRRAWFHLKGKGFDVIDYKYQAALNTDDVTILDMYVGISELPLLGHVRVGNFKEPFSLEQLTSSNHLTLMERSNADVFTPKRHIGVMAFDQSEGENLTWAIGAFASTDAKLAQDDHTASALTMRTTFLPWYDEATEGRGLLHTGIAYSYRDAWNDALLGDIRPSESHLGATYAAGLVNVDDVHLLGAELAMVYGPFSVQSEYIGAYVNGTAGDRYNAHGYYLTTSYFLTGEHRPYNRSGGVFGRVKPFENFFRVRAEDGNVYTGKGAWEIAYRWSYLDLTDGNIDGGRWSNHTLGLNWYLTPYTRIMWNYVYSTVSPDFSPGDPDSSLNVFQMRAQVDF